MTAPSRKTCQPVLRELDGFSQVRCGAAFVGEGAASERGWVALGADDRTLTLDVRVFVRGRSRCTM